MPEPPVIRVAPNPEVKMFEIESGRHCAVVDDFLQDPRALVDYASDHAHEFRIRPGPPGPTHPVDEQVLQEIQRFIRSRLSRHFPFMRAGITLHGRLSNVTLHPAELSMMQRICHIDPRYTGNSRTYAGLIYLFDNPGLGGTAFYRWNAPDVVDRAEELNKYDSEAALDFIREYSQYFRGKPQYMAGSNDIAELLAVVHARFNRLVFYDGELPHSGHISAPELLTDDMAKGRLTLNFFARVQPTIAHP